MDVPLLNTEQLLLPALQNVCGPSVLQEVIEQELNPVGSIEHILADEVVRRVEQSRQFEAALTIYRDQASQALLRIKSRDDQQDRSQLAMLATNIMASPRHEALFRQGLAASRAMFGAIGEFRKHRIANEPAANWIQSDPRFATEQHCLAHLARRHRNGTVFCRRCQTVTPGTYIAARAAWQCNKCGRQSGLRSGTCMNRSPLPLTAWFNVIRIILLHPTISTSDLAVAVRVSRQQTVNSMVHRIRDAVDSDQASLRLAGLDKLYLGVD